jgi:hypothetical protein
LIETVSGTKYEVAYLYLPIALILGIISYRIFLYIKSGRPEVYKPFDRYWFWGYFTLALVGLVIWFARSQSLPLISTRLVSYTWLLSLLVYACFLAFYFLRIIPQKLTTYYETQRKKKYLSK